MQTQDKPTKCTLLHIIIFTLQLQGFCVFLCFFFNRKVLIYEPVHDKTYNKTYATGKDSDQPAHLSSLFADHMCLLQPQGYLKRDKREPLPYWVDVQTDLSLLVAQVLLQVLSCVGSCAVSIHQNWLAEALPVSTHNIYFQGEIRRICTLCQDTFLNKPYELDSTFNPSPTEPEYALSLQTVQLQVSWLLKKQTDLDLHCLSLSM